MLWTETSTPRPGSNGDEITRKGFSTVVLQRVAPQSLGGSAELERSPGRLNWRLSGPRAGIEADADAALGFGI